jgi:hypothetical protein
MIMGTIEFDRAGLSHHDLLGGPGLVLVVYSRLAPFFCVSELE